MYRQVINHVAIAVLSLAVVGTPGLAAQPAAAAYRLVQTVSLGKPDRWDYVVFDADSQRVYVAHGDRVSVVDARGGKLLGEIGSFPGGTHGVAIVHATGKGYTDDGRAGTAAAFDLKSLGVLKTIKAEEDADAVRLDSASGHVFVVDGDGGQLTVIDPKDDHVVATIETGEKLEFAVPDERGALFVNGTGNREIVRVDTASNRITARWPMPACEGATGLAMDLATRRLFASCRNGHLMVIDADGGAVIAQLPIGRGTDGVAFDPRRKLIFSSNGQDGTLSVIREQDPATFVALPDIATARTARTMAIDPDTGRLFLAAADIDAAAESRAPAGPHRPAIVPGSLKLLVYQPAD